jgi:hypothetical protein
MNRFENMTKTVMWSTTLLLVAIVAGCGGGGDGIPGLGPGSGRSGPGPAGASPNLGTASTYGIIAGSAVTNDGSVIGDLAIFPGTSLTGSGTVSGTTNINNAAAHQAILDQNAAFTDASTRSAYACSITADLSVAQGACSGYAITPGTNSTVGAVTAATYQQGLYSTASTIGLATGMSMILDAKGNADAVFIFQSGSAITTGTSSVVILTGEAQAKNVWWVAPAGATLGVTSTFAGTVLADTGAVVVNNGTTVAGRLFSNTAAATVNSGSTITAP